MNAGRAFVVAWRVIPRLPGPVVRGLFDSAAVAAWALRGGGVRQLERNLGRLRPTAPRRDLRRLSLAGMRSYFRYYGEAFHMPAWSEARLDARVRPVGAETVRAELAAGRSAVLALAHTGNWDLAGTWAQRNIGSVVTVVERLEPEELFQAFQAFRVANGVTLVPFERGSGVFRQLLRYVRQGGWIVPLLADRDLTRGGIEVSLAGHPARVAAGPAALAVAAGTPVIPTHIRYERLHGARRLAAGTPWGTVLEFLPPIAVPEGASRDHAVAALTQAWVDAVIRRIDEHPESWHMLQKVFVADLDADRLQPAEGAVKE